MAYGDSLLECDWRSHPTYGDILVSDTGRVLSYKSGKWRELKPGLSGRGYLTICVGHDKTKPVHRLVAQTYIPNLDRKQQVNHIDGDKLNNRVSNLEWATASENEKHAYKTGLKTAHHKGRKVKIVESGEIFGSIRDCARKINGNQPSINRCLSGDRKTHRGLHFEYVIEEDKHE